MTESTAIFLGIGLIYGLSLSIMAYRLIRSNRVKKVNAMRERHAIEAAQEQLLAEAYRILNNHHHHGSA